MAISLIIRRPSGEKNQVGFEKTKLTIGSDALCDVTITDPGVDAQQALLIQRPGGVELYDVSETSPVLVNGRPTGHARIEPGMEIWIGQTVLTLATEGKEGVAFTEGVSTVREELPATTQPVVGQSLDDTLKGVGLTEMGERFALLTEVQRLINSIGTDANIFESILDTVFSTAPVRRGFIALGRSPDDISVKSHRSREKGDGGDIEVSRTLMGRVLETGKAVLTSDAEADSSFSTSQSIHRLRIRAAICVPMVVEGKVIGLLYGDNRERPGALTREHLAILSALASVAAAAVEKIRLLEEFSAKQQMEQALSIAQTIHRGFLPSRPPQMNWLDVSGRSDSCDETGGDYYDFLAEDDGSLRVAIADVTGHGVGPALLMATVRSALRALAVGEPSLERLVSRLNNLICNDVRDGRFITFFVGKFEVEGRRFHHVGAGHLPPILYRVKDRSTHLLQSKGPPLGIIRDMEFQTGTSLPLETGDILLFITDGIVEAENRGSEQFGFDRLRELVAENAGGSAKDLVEAVVAAVGRFTSARPLRDDATLVAVKVV